MADQEIYDWLGNLNQTLASVYAAGVARRGREPVEPVVRAFVDGYMKACEDFAVGAEAKEGVLRRAGLTGYPGAPPA